MSRCIKNDETISSKSPETEECSIWQWLAYIYLGVRIPTMFHRPMQRLGLCVCKGVGRANLGRVPWETIGIGMSQSEGWVNHGGFQQPGKGRDVMRCDCAVTTGESLVQGE